MARTDDELSCVVTCAACQAHWLLNSELGTRDDLLNLWSGVAVDAK